MIRHRWWLGLLACGFLLAVPLSARTDHRPALHAPASSDALAVGAASSHEELVPLPLIGPVPVIVQRLTLLAVTAIALGVSYAGFSFIARRPCPRCGSRKIRYMGARRHNSDAEQRCLSCGWTNA